MLNNLSLLKKLPNKCPFIDINLAFEWSAYYGLIDNVRLLLTDSLLDLSDSNAFNYACEFGYIEIVKLLLTDVRIDPTFENNYALRSCHNIEIVKMLLF